MKQPVQSCSTNTGSACTSNTVTTEYFSAQAHAERLGVPTDKSDTVILPLNSDDITGGVETAVRKNKDLRIFIREDAATDCAKKEKLLRVRNGLPQSFYKSDKYNIFRFERFTEICKDFYLVAVDKKEKSAETDRHYYIKKKGF